MKVYRVRADVNMYQSFTPEDEQVWQTDLLTFDATEKRATWPGIDVFVLQPLLRWGNFLDLCPGTFVVDSTAAETLQDLLELSGELLPLKYEGQQLFIVNVTECYAALDGNKSKWVYGRNTGKPIRIERFCFYPKRLPEVPLFKIPETARSEIYTIEGMKDPEDEFKSRVEQKGLEGLVFEEVWSD